jgi:hypothetical protein
LARKPHLKEETDMKLNMKPTDAPDVVVEDDAAGFDYNELFPAGMSTWLCEKFGLPRMAHSEWSGDEND